jgi:spore coat protein CotF
MPFGAHETMEVHEILNEKINMINHFSLYASQAQDRNLRQMIERHLQTAVQSYDQLVSYTHDYSAAPSASRSMGGFQVQPQHIQYGLHNPAQQMPQMQGQARLNDQQIVSAVLSCHKNSAKNHMHASLECADPNVRQMLLSGAISCSNQAYEVFLFMNQQGSYQVPTMNDHTAKTFLHSFQPVNASYGQQENMGSSMGASSMNSNPYSSSNGLGNMQQ